MVTTTCNQLDTLVNSCINFISQNGKVASMPITSGVSCLSMEFNDAEIIVQIEILMPKNSTKGFCTILVYNVNKIMLIASGRFETEAHDMRAHLYFHGDWEQKIRL